MNNTNTQGKVIVFSAPSGSGKSTIVKHLLKQNKNFEFCISATNREMRATEIHGKDYFFLTSHEFQQKIKNNDFLEWEEVYAGCYYGTLKSEIERIRKNGKHAILDVDVVGGLKIKQYFENEALAVFIKAPSAEELEKRLRNRNTDSEASIAKRIQKMEFELSFEKKFDKLIVNDKLEEALQETQNILNQFIKS